MAGFYRMHPMVARILALLLAVFVLQNAYPAAAQTAPDPIRYTLSFPEPHTHYVEVTAVVPTDQRPQVELMMAVWTAGFVPGAGVRTERGSRDPRPPRTDARSRSTSPTRIGG